MDTEIQAAIDRLRRQASQHTDGEDLIQEALARAHANGVSYSALPWLRTVVRRLAIDRSRRRRELAVGGADELERYELRGDADPAEQVVSEETLETLRRALASLPPRQREALLLLAQEGRSADVADRLGVNPGAAWALVCRARRRLREELERVGFVPAAVAARWERRLPALMQGGLAVGMAVTVALQGPAPLPRVEAAADVPVQAVASAQPPAARAPAPSMAVEEPVAAQASGRSPAASAPARETPFRWEAEACPGTEQDELLPTFEIVFHDDPEDESLSEDAVSALPEPAKQVEPWRCEG